MCFSSTCPFSSSFSCVLAIFFTRYSIIFTCVFILHDSYAFSSAYDLNVIFHLNHYPCFHLHLHFKSVFHLDLHVCFSSTCAFSSSFSCVLAIFIFTRYSIIFTCVLILHDSYAFSSAYDLNVIFHLNHYPCFHLHLHFKSVFHLDLHVRFSSTCAFSSSNLFFIFICASILICVFGHLHLYLCFHPHLASPIFIFNLIHLHLCFQSFLSVVFSIFTFICVLLLICAFHLHLHLCFSSLHYLLSPANVLSSSSGLSSLHFVLCFHLQMCFSFSCCCVFFIFIFTCAFHLPFLSVL